MQLEPAFRRTGIFLASICALAWILSTVRRLFDSGFAIGSLFFDPTYIIYTVLTALVLIRLGFFERHRAFKVVLGVAYLYGIGIVSASGSGRNLYNAFMPVFFTTAFLVTLYLLFKEKLAVYLKEPKASLSLKEKGLSAAEWLYVLYVCGGKSPKEAAFEYEVSESTVRNTLARAYKKLEIEDKSGLATLAERYQLVE